ncbi:elongation factor P maturation arginine rhamnosyltransferase EarP [Rhodoferax sp.]|uniref:elongation factor P maturation arginine rhamnosyltransferase EarP n=1 Tax=Rhodoferax sp. TaxID=50421 RepID=UPI00284A9191|nr:elongation factor P maturation arginine rhamnosyltransferase EarP [Rhodoferax sp.]MDR3370221.1 elongation factor P maturation arginine rhamnosyltransferase EarP [Rhodoferax sp.]
MHLPPVHPTLCWDIFCQVIDNFGDIGVCWRLAVNLAQRGQTVRLWVDDASALAWMAPEGAPGVQVFAWTTPFDAHGQAPGDVLVEAFGCDTDPEFIAAYASHIRAKGKKSLWINLEYLSAEGYVVRCHTLPSPVMQGPGQGLTKRFFYPGFTPDTGGLLREPDLLQRQVGFDRAAWLAGQGIDWQGQRLVSLFCYEPPGLAALLQALAADAVPTLLLVTPGRAAAAVRQLIGDKIDLQPLCNKGSMLSISYAPVFSQTDYDQLLWACDLNFVRGEDSLVRALWAGKPFVWQIYPQHDDAHHNKLNAFLDWLQAPPSLRRTHAIWNGLPGASTTEPVAPLMKQETLLEWPITFTRARQSLLAQNDLASQLLDFIAKTH